MLLIIGNLQAADPSADGDAIVFGIIVLGWAVLIVIFAPFYIWDRITVGGMRIAWSWDARLLQRGSLIAVSTQGGKRCVGPMLL